MTLQEQFPCTFRASGVTRPDETLFNLQDDDLQLALRGWRLGTIVALDHPPKDLVCPFSGDNGVSSLLKTVFHRIFDPSSRTGAWLLHGNNHDLPGCIEKCFFVTSDGQCGLCPWTAKEGDVVTVLQGGNVPYLIRPLEKESADQSDKYAFVGECFVEELMLGFVTKDEMRQREVFALR